jgi:hypothetical protein
MSFHQLVDMANTPEDLKEDNAAYPATVAAGATGPVYPYGLAIRLTERELEKIGLEDEKPSVGDMIHLFAMAKVTSVSENEVEVNGEKKSKCCVELQITHLGAEDEDTEDPDERLERNEARDRERSDAFYKEEEDEE